jgi:hypothetical protein
MCRAQRIILLRKNKQKPMLLDNAETDPWKLMNRVNNDTNEMLTLIIISASTILSCATLLVASLKIQMRKTIPFYTKLMLPVVLHVVIKLFAESPGMYCSNGKMVLTEPNFPLLWQNFLSSQDDIAKHFRDNIRLYNSAFTFISVSSLTTC